MSAHAWNHNIHYHDFVVRSVRANCRRALDVGCGQGLLSRKLARHCEEVVAIDVDRDALSLARAANATEPRITFVEGDVMTRPFPDNSFDFITAVATLHHLPLRLALERFRDLLKSGGTLSVIGLYRLHDLQDYAWAAAAYPSSWTLRRLHKYEKVRAPLQDPRETLREIRAACDAILPGAAFQRCLLFRYSLTWRKP